MMIIITSVDFAPDELHAQVPFEIELIREIAGSDRPDYWIGSVDKPIRWVKEKNEIHITHLVLAARWKDSAIGPGMKDLPLGIAFVTDQSLLEDETLDFKKCEYTAIGIGTEILE